jgi:hypothetical protein
MLLPSYIPFEYFPRLANTILRSTSSSILFVSKAGALDLVPSSVLSTSSSI